MPGKRYGIDPGTMSLRICQSGKGLIVSEKNLIAYNKKSVYATGDEAYDMYERTPASIKVSRPVIGGVIADMEALSKNAEVLLKKAGLSSGLLRTNHFYIAVPTDITEVEKRAYYSLITHSSFNTRHVNLVEKPIAVAIGENLSFAGSDPAMIVDMGAGATEISILMMGGIAVSTLLKEGGLSINDSIIQSVKKEYELLIGEKSAEYLKFELGNAVPDSKRSVTIYGRHIISGLPSEADVNVNIVYEAMKDYFVNVVQTIHNMIGKVPGHQAARIAQNGIFFTGGTALTTKLPELFESTLRVRVNFSENPTESAVRGLARIMQDTSAYRDYIFSMRDGSFE